MNIQPMNFVKNLTVMGKGMLGIFVAIGLIVLSIVLLNAVSGRKNGNGQEGSRD